MLNLAESVHIQLLLLLMNMVWIVSLVLSLAQPHPTHNKCKKE